MESLEDFKLIMDLSGAEHVKDLHHDERGEDEGQVAGWTPAFLKLSSFFFDSVEGLAVPVVRSAWVNIRGRLTIFKGESFTGFDIVLTLRDHELTVEQEEEKHECLPDGLS